MTGTRYVSKWVLVLAALALATTSWAFVASRLTHPAHVALPRMQPRAIVWDNRVFSSRAALASWLSSRGTTYQHWARLHRADAAIVEHVRVHSFTPPTRQAVGTVRRSGSQQAAGVGRPSASVTDRAPAPGTATASNSLAWAPFVLLVLGTLAMLAAVIPGALVQLSGADWFSATRRTYVFALGFTISVGVLIASFHA